MNETNLHNNATFAEAVAKTCGHIEMCYALEIKTHKFEVGVPQGTVVSEFNLALLEMLTNDNAELANIPNEGTPEPWLSRLEAETLQYTVGEWFDTGLQQVKVTPHEYVKSLFYVELKATEWV